MSIKFLVFFFWGGGVFWVLGGGGECRFYFYGRTNLIEGLIFLLGLALSAKSASRPPPPRDFE